MKFIYNSINKRTSKVKEIGRDEALNFIKKYDKNPHDVMKNIEKKGSGKIKGTYCILEVLKKASKTK